jgi:hypothetical protein
LDDVVLAVAIACYTRGCARCFPDEKRSFPRTPYTGDELRVEWYYYCFSQGPDAYGTRIRFFYRNGILLVEFYQPTQNLDSIDMNLVEEFDALRKSKDRWKPGWGYS